MHGDHGDDIKFLITDTPAFPEDEARRIAKHLFGIDGALAYLESDRDQNFRLWNDDGQWLLKFFHPEEDPGVADFQAAALTHIATTDPSLPVPKVIATKRGRPWARVKAPDGRSSIVRLMSWLPGTVLEGMEHTPRLRRHAGAFVARLDRALAGFFHPSAMHTLVWDTRQAPQLRRHSGDIVDRAARKAVERALDRFIEASLPRWPRLRAQVIHNDANRGNLVLDPARPDEVAGVIDFGDMIHGPIAAEAAMAVESFLVGFDDPLTHMIDVLLGFDSVMPLQEEEVDVLFDMVTARLAVIAVILARRDAYRTGSPAHMQGYEAESTIDQMLSVGAEAATDMFRDALRFPARGTMGTVATPETDGLAQQLERRRRYFGRHLSLFYDKPLHLERGRGAILYDANGRAFVDAYNNVASVGHCHPHVVNAVWRQTAVLGTNTRYVYRALADYAERLQATMPRHLRRCVMVNSGSEANDIAWRMATLLTGNRGAIVMEHAYHGITDAIAALSPAAGGHRDAPHVRMLVAPDPYRGPWRRGEAGLAGRYAADADRAIAELEKAGFGTACLMVDTSFCTNGIPEVPKGYLKQVAAKVRRAGGLVIADEVQYGFARPGSHMWGFQYHGMRPDIVTLGKPVGDGFPLGVAVTTTAILDAFAGATGLFSTFGGNPPACAAGLAVLDVIEREGLMENAAATGAYLKRSLKELMARHSAIGDVRGHGFIVGVELVKDRASREPDPERTVAVLNRMRELGVLVGREGPFGNVFKIRPPLVFSRSNADTLVAAMDRALAGI